MAGKKKAGKAKPKAKRAKFRKRLLRNPRVVNDRIYHAKTKLKKPKPKKLKPKPKKIIKKKLPAKKKITKKPAKKKTAPAPPRAPQERPRVELIKAAQQLLLTTECKPEPPAEGIKTKKEAKPEEEIEPEEEIKPEKEAAPEEEIKPEEEIIPEEETKPEEEKPEEKIELEGEARPEEKKAEEEIPAPKPEPKAKPKPETSKPETAKSAPAQPAEIYPAFDMLPRWQDRNRLNRAVDDAGMTFSAPQKGSKEFTTASLLLAKSGRVDSTKPGYLLVAMKGRTGLLGAADGYIIQEEESKILVLARAVISGTGKASDNHLVLHALLLAATKPTHVLCSIEYPDLSSPESIGRLVFFGRGLGLYAMPLKHPSLLFFIRRMGDSSTIIPGLEIASVLGAYNKLLPGKSIAALAGEFAKKESVALVMLPLSPDPVEHLQEIKDAVQQLGLPSEALNKSFAVLERQYLHGRADITPTSLF